MDEKFEHLKNAKCLMLTEHFECSNTRLFSVLETVVFNGSELTLVSLQPGVRVETKGLCIWKGEITSCFHVPGTEFGNGGVEKRFII